MEEIKTKSKNKKCIHDGHRKRLVDTVDQVGLYGLSDVQALEYILFFIFPRGDVNPLAHRLLDRFNDTQTVLEASVEDLMAVDGIGEMAAKKIHSLLEIYSYYTSQKLNSQPIKTMGEFYDYMEQLLRYRSDEELHIFGVNCSGEVIRGRRFASGSFNLVSVNMREVALFISTYKVPAVVIVHNHPNGSAMPSKQDEISYAKMKQVFNFSGCRLTDSIIIGKDGIFSMEANTYQRFFDSKIEVLKLKSQG